MPHARVAAGTLTAFLNRLALCAGLSLGSAIPSFIWAVQPGDFEPAGMLIGVVVVTLGLTLLASLADEAGADHQLVRRDDGVSGRFLGGRDKKLCPFHGGRNTGCGTGLQPVDRVWHRFSIGDQLCCGSGFPAGL